MIYSVCIICCSLVQFQLKLVHSTSNEVKLQSTRRNEAKQKECPIQSSPRNMNSVWFYDDRLRSETHWQCFRLSSNRAASVCRCHLALSFVFPNPLIYTNSIKPLHYVLTLRTAYMSLKIWFEKMTYLCDHAMCIQLKYMVTKKELAKRVSVCARSIKLERIKLATVLLYIMMCDCLRALWLAGPSGSSYGKSD